MPYKHFIPVHAVSALGCFVATLSLNQRPLSGCYNPRAMEPKRTPSPPTTTTGVVILGKYQLGRLLGRGSFAKVYHGRSLSDSTTVAIKVIDKAKTVTAAMEPHIVREVAAMRRLNNHPNILKIHEVLATKTKIYLVMELAQGGELFAHLARRGRLTEPAARRYFRQLVSALRFCHQNGVTHRDIKPQNILLDEAGNLKVSDFGLSALPEQLRNGMLHTACGTPAYTAPEVFTRKGYDGAKADAWSCGVLLFVFLAGYLPFDDSNIPNMYKKIRRREFQLPASISKPAKHVINRLLDPNPDTRMSIEALMGHSWFKKSSEKESNHCSSLDLDTITAKDCNYTITMNAFDIISMSSGLDLSGLFEGSVNKRGKRFTSKASVELIEERMREVGERLGYRVERGKGGTIGFLKEKWAVLSAKMLEVTEELVLVEVKVIDGWAELEELHWDELRAGLEDIVVSWHSDGFGEEAQLEL